MEFWLKRFRNDPWQTGIMTFVMGVHLIFLAIILISPAFHFHKKERKKLIVKTVAAPKPPAPKVQAQSKAPAKSPSSAQHVAFPKPAQKPAPKKEAPPAPVQKQAPVKKQTPVKKETTTPAAKKEPAIADKKIGTPKPAAAPKKNPPKPPERAKISDSLLKELEESIAKIESGGDKKVHAPKKTLFAPVPLQIDAPAADAGDGDYTDALVGYLHQCLTLPDYGEVKIQLSLRQDGTVIKLVVLKAQSEKNKQYLEKNLPQLRFPRFDGAYANKKECVFTFTFCNE